MYVCRGAVQAVWEPVVPLKAMAGMPSLAASVAAPTVPDIRTVLPRFAVKRRQSDLRASYKKDLGQKD